LRAAEAAAGAVAEPTPSAQQQAGTDTGATAQDRTKPPSPNRGNGERPGPAQRTPGRSSRPATPRPPNLPAYVDWEAEQRIMDILFSDDDPPTDDKPG
jgi:hypothetical protein